ncbi:hypothetical protein R3P38DRAFT_3536182 [Favolaschia claudopus]|uniref:Uncharacterized protein n=1 Tax=Favolaschia claudopus TaxID=2862362 RepID=A0AAW0BE71_9AGAR
MCEYLPRSLADRHSMPPRVFLIDFEAAVDFPPESRPEDRLVSSHFFGDEFTRARAPELREKDTPYNPFALDIWQLGYKMSMFSTKIEAVDSIVQEMIRDEPKSPTDGKGHFRPMRTFESLLEEQKLVCLPWVDGWSVYGWLQNPIGIMEVVTSEKFLNPKSAKHAVPFLIFKRRSAQKALTRAAFGEGPA